MKKGFTLVELLGVITILGIIALIIIPVVENSNKKIKKRAYEKQKDAIILALKDYRTSSPELFYNTDTVTLTLGELKYLGYIDFDLKNPKTNKCISNNLSLKIDKNRNTYEYSIIGDELIDGEDYDCDVEGGKYVYFQTAKTFTNTIEETRPTRPTTHNAYIKLEVENGVLKNPQACIYDDEIEEKELCLKNNEYETSIQSIKRYFKYDDPNWEQSGNTCYFNGYDVTCKNSRVYAYTDDEGFVNTKDVVTNFSCGLNDEGTAYCSN